MVEILYPGVIMFIAGRISAWLVVLVGLLAGGAVIATAGDARTSNDPTAALPASAESTRVAALQRQLPSGRSSAALIVYSRGGQPLTASDQQAIAADAGRFGAPPIYSTGKDAALVAVPVPADLGASDLIARVTSIRASVQHDGLTAQVTGGAGFSADIADSFSGANTNLLIVTVVVVAVLLLVTYRSPILWVVPLAVVGLADQVSSALIAVLSRHTDLAVSDATTGIVTVLVFGAGTDYALLLISRYREELHRYDDRREAMRRAIGAAGPAVAASAATVVLSLLTLALADLGDTKALGITGAVGIAVAAVFALVMLPAALVVCGRRLFWPFVPRVGDGRADGTNGVWARVGHAVAGRPVRVTVISVIVLGVLSAGLIGTRLGLSQTEQFRVEAESVAGLTTLSRYFPAGAADPVVVLAAPAAADRVVTAAAGTPGVARADVAERTPALVRIDAVLTAAPDTDASYAAIRALRERVHTVPGGGALVGGEVATALDTRDASRRDLRVIVPVVLLVVLVILGVLLRAVVAAVLLITTVIATFAAALGAGSWLFRHVFDYPALDDQVPLLAFLFLVALGIDYNIFLVTRARSDGMIRALAATGAVITSAGVLLAAVFAVLGVLPVITLTQIGVIVGLGVLLDTLLVRTVLVPALATLLGDRFWWPGRPAARGAPAEEPAEELSAAHA
jgi:RND superfamily putative drug exporter